MAAGAGLHRLFQPDTQAGRPARAVRLGRWLTPPENRMASFLLDEASGADEIELDIRITADAVPVVRDDPTLPPL